MVVIPKGAPLADRMTDGLTDCFEVSGVGELETVLLVILSIAPDLLPDTGSSRTGFAPGTGNTTLSDSGSATDSGRASAFGGRRDHDLSASRGGESQRLSDVVFGASSAQSGP